MEGSPFDACWDRLDRMESHRVALGQVWNDFIEDHPFSSKLHHEGGGIHILRVEQMRPMPAAFALELGEWLYNARSLLDYIVWSTAAYVSGSIPPPGEEKLQYPIYESAKGWKNNEGRLAELAPHHRSMLLEMQPFNSDPDANYLGFIHDLARIDRHRRMTHSTAYLAEVEPVFEAPAGADLTLEWGQRVLVDGVADVARITVAPWDGDSTLRVNPRMGIDPEVGDWAHSKFWRGVRFGKRLAMIQLFLTGEIAVYEYDCTGDTRQPDFLTDGYRAECDARGPCGPITPAPAKDVDWVPAGTGRRSTPERFGRNLVTRSSPIHPRTTSRAW